jgi:hypothetical protein
MGFLNHATNNIIIDAVLTERGREYLAQNNGAFKIESFSFGDDEVDYTLLEKYGISIGKEKIEKNTPIFEANPNENIALKHQCFSLPNPLTRLEKLPYLVWENKNERAGISLSDVQGTGTEVQSDIVIRNFVDNVATTYNLDANINDNKMIIRMHNDLLRISSVEPSDRDLNNIATYILPAPTIGGGSFSNQRESNFTVFTNGIVTSDDFTKYGSVGNVNLINTKIQIIGQSSGSSLIIPVTITRQVNN